MERNQIKISVILFILSFLLLSIVFSANFAYAYENSDTIIVDQDGTGDYTTITEAVQAAQTGDTILVHSGVYTEDTIYINTSLLLSGEDPKTTIIRGDDTSTILSIQADHVAIRGFTITRGGGMLGQNVDIYGNNCFILHNIISSNDVGIAIHDSLQSQIISNQITNCSFAGIRVYYCNYSNFITNNTISDCISAIYVYDSEFQDIKENSVKDCSNGIYLEECTDNVVKRNQIMYNGRGMFVSYANNNLITENNFMANEEHAKFTTWLSPTGLQISAWESNYWDNSIAFLPEWIPGVLFIRTYNPIGIFLPWGSFDWNPAQHPYEITK